MDNPGGFTAEQIIQMQAMLRKRGKRFKNNAKYLNRYPYRGQSAVIDEEVGGGGGAGTATSPWSLFILHQLGS